MANNIKSHDIKLKKEILEKIKWHFKEDDIGYHV